MMTRIAISIVLMMVAGVGISQDALFSNLNNAISSYSVADISVNRYENQVGLNYRRALNLTGAQSPNRIYSVYWNRHINLGDDHLTTELRVTQDNPTNTILVKNDIMASVRFSKTLSQASDSYQRLSVGATIGANLLNPTNESFWYGNQYDVENQAVNFDIPSGEPLVDRLVSRSALDMAIGLSWQGRLSSGIQYGIGGSLYHMSPYNESIIDNSTLLISRRYSGYAHLSLPVAGSVRYGTTAIVQHQDPFLAFSWRHTISFREGGADGFIFGVGVVPRLVDHFDGFGMESLGFCAVLEYDAYTIDLIYEIGVGDIDQFSDRRGNFEFAIAYLFGGDGSRRSSFIY